MKLFSILFISWAVVFEATAQDNRGHVWSSGYGTLLDFNGAQPKLLKNKYKIDKEFRTASSICDSITGALQFCSNGYTLFDSALNVVQNGDTIADLNYYIAFANSMGNICNQADLLLPVADKYFYINTGSSYGVPGFVSVFNRMYYSILDPKANGGLGAVVSKKNMFYEDSVGGVGLQALRHANGMDWWLYKAGCNAYATDDSFKVFRWLITAAGISNFTVIKFPPVGFFTGDDQWSLAGIHFNEQGTKMAIGRITSFYMADVNRCTGELSNKQRIVPENTWKYWEPNGTDTFTVVNQSDSTWDVAISGLCYSPNGKYIYVVKRNSIWQWEWADTNTSTAWVVIRSGRDTLWPNSNIFINAKLGPDNRIYIGTFGTPQDAWQVIDSPDVKGHGCSLQLRKILLPYGTFPQGGLTYPSNSPNYKLGKDPSICWPTALPPEEQSKQQISIYPNPARNSITVSYACNGSKNGVLHLYDVLGHEVLRASLPAHAKASTISVAGLAVGLYSYKVVFEGCGVFAGKLQIE
jgi:Secretion system C-terminal sorting domain